jgi:hypothetical protein
MKKMKTTIAATVALAACASTQLFAQSVKEDVITFSLTEQGQNSVSVSTAANAGNYSQLPTHYKTLSKKLTQTDILHSIGIVLHGSPSYYSSKAQLVLVQGELSGFFDITPDLDGSSRDTNALLGAKGGLSGTFTSADTDTMTDLPNSFDSTFATLDNGRNFPKNPITDTYPVGHIQPWGQIFVKDIGKAGYSATTPLCENVTYFFALTVQECYDCFYLNSFISDSVFTFKPGSQVNGPPCCSNPTNMVGTGTDKYYLTLSFDNTVNNPYLNYDNPEYVGIDGLISDTVYFDLANPEGIAPDMLPYADPIKSGFNTADPKIYPYVMRFTLNGIMTYKWTLKFINTSDVSPDFIGTGSYAANGYGFVDLICQLFTGSATFTEKAVKTSCCLADPWYDYVSNGVSGGWYGVGNYYWIPDSNLFFDYEGYGTPAVATPLNGGANLTYHANFNEAYEPWEVQTTW